MGARNVAEVPGVASGRLRLLRGAGSAPPQSRQRAPQPYRHPGRRMPSCSVASTSSGSSAGSDCISSTGSAISSTESGSAATCSASVDSAPPRRRGSRRGRRGRSRWRRHPGAGPRLRRTPTAEPRRRWRARPRRARRQGTRGDLIQTVGEARGLPRGDVARAVGAGQQLDRHVLKQVRQLRVADDVTKARGRIPQAKMVAELGNELEDALGPSGSSLVMSGALGATSTSASRFLGPIVTFLMSNS